MRRTVLLLTLVAAILLACAGVVLAQNAAPDRTTPDPEQTASNGGQQRAGDVIPGKYIVVLRDDADPRAVANEHANQHSARVTHIYQYALKAYTAELPEQALRGVRNDPRVQFISEDREVQALGEAPTGVQRIGASSDGENQTLSNKGTGVSVAVLDTGIDLDHPDLYSGNLLQKGKNCINSRKAPDDGHGHGSHVAGTIAARDNATGVVGTAPGSKLYAVKVLNDRGSGTWSQVICGIDWVTSTLINQDGSPEGNPDNDIHVANMSLGGWLDKEDDPDAGDDGNCGNTNNDALHKAICGSVVAGVTYAVAAGNDEWEIYDGRWTAVPAAYDEVLAVTAVADGDGKPGGLKNPSCRSDKDDTSADFSNFATSEDEAHTIAAPGVCIRSAWKGGGYATASGTSMASPHIAGVAALCIASGNCGTGDPASVMSTLRSVAAAQPATYGFKDDPNSPNGSRYYGYLTYAGGY